MVVIRDYSGIPSSQCGPPLSIHVGDIIELMFADLHSSWWQVRVTQLNLVLSQHLWLYEKVTCYGWLGLVWCTQCLCTVMTLNLCCMLHLPLMLDDSVRWQKSFQKCRLMWWLQQFISLWPPFAINHLLHCCCSSHRVSYQVSRKCDSMMRSAPIKNISWRFVWASLDPCYITNGVFGCSFTL